MTVAHTDGPGRVVFEREADVLAEFAGALLDADHLVTTDGHWPSKTKLKLTTTITAI